jgi:spore coat polysaccharide biosynthesis predicted glycosyltransferase SpsG
LSQVIRELFDSENIFLMRGHPEGTKHARDAGEKVKMLARHQKNEADDVLNVADDFKADWLIVDLPYSDLDISYFRSLKDRGIKIVFIDDFRFIDPGANVLINSNILASDKMKIYCRDDVRYFLGPEFFIFDESAKNKNPRRKAELLNILLTFGGSDPTNLTRKVVKTLLKERWPLFMVFRVILGPGYSAVGDLKSLIGSRKDFEIITRPQDIIPYFLGSDLTVCAGGRTMYELFYLNKKFLPIATSDHEAEAVVSFMERGLVDVGLPVWNSADLIDKIKKFCAGEATLYENSENRKT